MTPVKSFRDLEAWQLGMELLVPTYRLTKAFPRPEQLYGLGHEMRRTAVSNIAEGHRRRLPGPFANHVSVALGSQGGLETQFEAAWRAGLLGAADHAAARDLVGRVGQVLSGLARSIANSR